jgi:hypothetical protein
MKNLKRFLLRLCFTIIVTSSVSDFLIAQSGIYVGGHFRRERPATIDILKASGFTYAILFNIHVEPNGDLKMDGDLMCSNGSYVFGAKHPYYVADVNSLKTGTTTIKRVESCIGGWLSPSYTNIKNLINSQGTGTGSILYKNFQALRKAIPSIDAINCDDEETYDASTCIKFFVMLRDIGFKATLAPYTNPSFWTNVASSINSQRPGTVDRIDLQCYDGGANNNPCNWNFGSIPVYAGLSYFDSKATIQTKLTNWKNNCSNVKGGFIWVYNENSTQPSEYAAVINPVFGLPAPCAIRPYVSINNSGTWQQITSISLKPGDKVTIGPHPLNIGTWSWTGPNGFTASTRSITLNSVQLDMAGTYQATFSNNGCTSVMNFYVSVYSGSAFTLRVEAENYGFSSGIIVENCNDPEQPVSPPRKNVGSFDANNWTSYSVTIPATGTYKITYRLASIHSGRKLQLNKDAGATVLGSVDVPFTGNWQSWTSASHYVTLPSGTYFLELTTPTGGLNINWFEISNNMASAARSIAVETPEIAVNDTEDFISSYPNPFEGNTKVTVNLPQAGHTNISVKSGLHEIGNLHNGYLDAGVHEFEFNAINLPTGMYVCTVTQKGKTKVTRIVKKAQ